jgi:pimeloyl-ACP methyl ester carboxylesterase
MQGPVTTSVAGRCHLAGGVRARNRPFRVRHRKLTPGSIPLDDLKRSDARRHSLHVVHLTKEHAMRRTRIARPSIGAFILLGIGAVASGAQAVTSSEAREKKLMSPVLAQQGQALSRMVGAGKPTIILVHGAFADGSAWQDVVPLLQRDGYKVIAVQNSLAMLAEDIATTKRVIDAETQHGRTVVAVGHSYGGAVISGAAAGNANVKALVFIAAFAPDAGEPVGAFNEKYPSDLGTALVPDAAGFVYIDVDKYHGVFAGDLPLHQTRAMAVAQKPIFGAIFGQSVPAAAWRTIPSWYLVAQQDRSINPDLERFYAKRMNATTSEIKSSHLPFISQPQKVAALIEAAASANPR